MDKITIGVLMVGGKGVRALPYSKLSPKALFEIDGRTLLEHNLSIMSKKLRLNKIVVMAGYRVELIENKIRELSQNIESEIIVKRVEPDLLRLGLLGGIAALIDMKDELKNPFIVVLGDEFFLDPEHDKMQQAVEEDSESNIWCMIKKNTDPADCLKNYAVKYERGKILELKEKPKDDSSGYFGLGVLILRYEVVLKAKEETKKLKPRNFVNMLNDFVGTPYGIKGYITNSQYVNINTPTDIYTARKIVHRSKFDSYKKSVVIPAYNEAESIYYVVKDFIQYCDEVIVMDNQSPDNTAKIAASAGAVVYSEKLKGYGDAIRKGLEKATGDILILAEADGTFRGEDIEKFMPFLLSGDAVVGSRTHWQFLEYGANMGELLRFGNIAFGIMMALLWWNRKSRFTDVGCTFQAMWKSTYQKIRNRLIGNGPELAPELTVEMLNLFIRVIEIPIPYHARVLGKSKFSGSIFHSARTALRMLIMILRKRFSGWILNIKNLISG